MVSMHSWKTKSILKLSFIYHILHYQFAGVNLKAVFRIWLGIMVLTQICRSRFKQSKISLPIPYIYVYVRFVNVFGDFWVYLWINSFPQRISKIYLMLFKNQNW